MNEVGAFFTAEQGRLLWQWYLTQQQLQPQLTKNFPQRRPVEDVSPHRVFVKNTEEEVIPPYACMRVIGTEVVGERTVVKVEKPSSISGEFLFNGPYEIPVPADEIPAEGETPATPAVPGCGWAYRYGVVVMLGEPGSGSGSATGSGVGEEAVIDYEPMVGAWTITPGSGPFTVFGPYELPTVERALIGRINGGGSQIRWGKVTASHGCGMYTIELGTLDGSSDDSTSLSGSGAECSPFGVITGEGTEGCSTSISLRPERVIGSGVFVEAYDPASTVIPLIVGTDCIVWKSGGSAVGSGSASTSGSGSGTTSSGWGVLRGRMNEVLKYEEDGECCGTSGEWVTTRKKPTIYIAIDGEWIDCADCPSGSA